MSLLTVQMLGVVLVVSVLFLEIWRTRRSERIICAWTRRNNYRLVEGRNMVFLPWPFSSNPFFWKRSVQQAVYRITVRDLDGATKSGWVLCGGWRSGVATNDIKVHWDDPTTERK